MNIKTVRTIRGFKQPQKRKINPAHSARSLEAKKRLITCLNLIVGGERNMNVLCNALNVHRATLIRYLNSLADERLIKVRCVKGCKYKILGTL